MNIPSFQTDTSLSRDRTIRRYLRNCIFPPPNAVYLDAIRTNICIKDVMISHSIQSRYFLRNPLRNALSPGKVSDLEIS
jgi:hypothetical protein